MPATKWAKNVVNAELTVCIRTISECDRDHMTETKQFPPHLRCNTTLSYSTSTIYVVS